MKKSFKYLFIAAVSAFALAACDNLEDPSLNPSGTPVKLFLSGDNAFTGTKAAVKVTSDAAAPVDISVQLSLDAASTIKTDNIVFPDLTIKKGDTEASGYIQVVPEGLRPGAKFAVVVKGTYAGVDLGNKVSLTFTTEAEPEEPAPSAAITIDGDMSDWTDVKGVTSEDGPLYAFKATYDADNVYCYVKRNNDAAMWGGGYLYFDFDLDSNPNTGTEKDNIIGLETWMYMYYFLAQDDGTHYIADAPTGELWTGGAEGSAASYECPAGSCKGVFDDEYAEVEVKISRKDLGIKSGDEATIYCWGNKSGSNLKTEPVYVTFKD